MKIGEVARLAGTNVERRASFDVADFPMPTGLEEDGQFTPMHLDKPYFLDPAKGATLAVDS